VRRILRLLAGAAALHAGASFAQAQAPSDVEPAPESAPRRPPLVTKPGEAAPVAEPRRRFTLIQPTFSVLEAYSDNAGLQPAELARSGWVTDLVPGIHIEHKAARFDSYLTYRLHQIDYSTASHLNRHENYLQAFARLEAIEHHGFVDARADINQLNTSPFGVVTAPGSSIPGTNRVETRSAQVSPFARGALSGAISYELRATQTGVKTEGDALPFTQSREALARLANAAPGTRFGWSVDATTLELRNAVVGQEDDTRVRASLIYGASSDLKLLLLAGEESTDFAGPEHKQNDMPGAGIEWTPGPRTRFSALAEKRFFGTGHNVLFTHRTPRTAWRVSSLKDATVLPAQLKTSTIGTLRALMEDVFASSIPDADERAQAIRRRLERSGLAEYTPINSEFLQARPYTLRLDEFSFAALGAVNTITFAATRREQHALGQSLGGVPPVPDDDFLQTGRQLEASHRLSALTSVSLSAIDLRTKSLNGVRRSQQRQLSIFLRKQLTPRTTGTFGVHRIIFDSSVPAESFRENEIYFIISAEL
jgi:uncharacterized protein (PEP-CTERM system associated)